MWVYVVGYARIGKNSIKKLLECCFMGKRLFLTLLPLTRVFKLLYSLMLHCNNFQ